MDDENHGHVINESEHVQHDQRSTERLLLDRKLRMVDVLICGIEEQAFIEK